MASDEAREIRGYCGHLVGTLTGPILVSVWCRECGGYVSTEWRDGKPVIVSTQLLEPKHGEPLTVDTWSDGDVRLTIAQDGEFCQAVFSGEQLAALRELLDRAAMPGQTCRRPCCDHCNNGEGDPDGHDYVPGASVHEGRCEQCAAERARREHDEGTG